MRFIPVTGAQRESMLRFCGVGSAQELFAGLPDDVRVSGSLALPGPSSEDELVRHVRELASRNVPAGSLVSFAGAGCYDHYVPSVVRHVLANPRLYTAYTPYQPEVSQGTLQATYEYQTMICELTGMDVANGSMYDGATALVEASLMAVRLTGRRRIVVSAAVHPEWRETLATYAAAGVLTCDTVAAPDGVTDLDALRATLDDEVAAVALASPNFFGNLESVELAATAAHGVGALCVAVANPILMGVIEPPGALGADIVVGEGQPLGGAMSFGGPGFGFFACRDAHVRQMPGRVAGRTVDADGDVAYVLTLATREQHIRRERATSNICSNHTLSALAAGAYLAALGADGLAHLARACLAKARYLRERLLATGRFTPPWEQPFGYEFALAYEGDLLEMHAVMLERGYLAGVRVTGPDGGDLVLFAVTERRTRAEIDAFVSEVGAL